ncbi:response regulator transcription factor [Yinghuangia soli]|uniref:Helix-turn-helix transcriptional regulator n=1 Tax=Yinghuangia soli TaxID=2908204 RepID=A0AA41Q535_9ACTN|nr:helix-turn-helix transcriptional regulator [Yinghuangia soli]MCF2531724.1 helix-turn-helix transcriptional regulator [Yinghuangia soli]
MTAIAPPAVAAAIRGALTDRLRAFRVPRAEHLATVLADTAIRTIRSYGWEIRPEPARRSDIPRITHRRRQVLVLVAAGLTSEQAAQHLDLTDRGIQSHIRELLVILGAQSRTELAVRAIAYGLVTPDEALAAADATRTRSPAA